jgi:ABC-type methionine transport system permease subunit
MGFVTLLNRSRQTDSLPAIVPLSVSIRLELSGPSASGNRLLLRSAFFRAKLAVFTLTEIGGVIDRLRTAGASPDRPAAHSLVA